MVVSRRSLLAGALSAACLSQACLPEAVGSSRRTVAGFTFNTCDCGIFDLPRESDPYLCRVPVPQVDAQPHDADGVRMTEVGGRLYDHPVAQASYGLGNLESYRTTLRMAYLDRARRQADRLLSKATRVSGAWYFPYPFSFDPHGLVTERRFEPWYSAMAQGQALSLFVRLAETTGEVQYRTAADAVFATFLRPQGQATPWTVWVDHGGYLWLEEYPGLRPDRTFNGLIHSAWGLWDYWRLTRDARAQSLWDGAITTVLAYASSIRNAGWASSYCASHPWSIAAEYHLIHIVQLATLYRMSHHPALARYAEALIGDYPPPALKGTVSLPAGRLTGFRFSSKGRVLRHRTLRLSRRSSASTDNRVRIKNRGIWYRVTNGPLEGLYVPESPPTVVLQGSCVSMDWDPVRSGRLAAGREAVGRVFEASGAVIQTRRFSPSEATPVGVSRTAFWNGVRHAYVADGPLTGYWVPTSSIWFS